MTTSVTYIDKDTYNNLILKHDGKAIDGGFYYATDKQKVYYGQGVRIKPLVDPFAGGNLPSHNHDSRYYTKTQIDNFDFLTSLPSHDHNSEYYTKTEINNAGFLTSLPIHDHDSRYYTKNEIDNAGYLTSLPNHNHNSLYYTKNEIDNAGYLTSLPSHNHDSRYYTESEVDTALSGKEDSLGNPATDGYILSSLANGTRSWVAPPTSGGSVPTLVDDRVVYGNYQQEAGFEYISADGRLLIDGKNLTNKPTLQLVNVGIGTGAIKISGKINYTLAQASGNIRSYILNSGIRDFLIGGAVGLSGKHSLYRFGGDANATNTITEGIMQVLSDNNKRYYTGTDGGGSDKFYVNYDGSAFFDNTLTINNLDTANDVDYVIGRDSINRLVRMQSLNSIMHINYQQTSDPTTIPNGSMYLYSSGNNRELRFKGFDGSNQTIHTWTELP